MLAHTNLPYTWMNVTHTHTHTTNALPHSTKLCCKLWIDHSHACHTHMPLTCTTYTHKYAHVHECRIVDQITAQMYWRNTQTEKPYKCRNSWKRLRQHIHTYIHTWCVRAHAHSLTAHPHALQHVPHNTPISIKHLTASLCQTAPPPSLTNGSARSYL